MKLCFSLTVAYICINLDAHGTEFRGVDTCKPSKVSLLLDHYQNGLGSFDFVSSSLSTFLRCVYQFPKRITKCSYFSKFVDNLMN